MRAPCFKECPELSKALKPLNIDYYAVSFILRNSTKLYNKFSHITENEMKKLILYYARNGKLLVILNAIIYNEPNINFSNFKEVAEKKGQLKFPFKVFEPFEEEKMDRFLNT
ncbi:MAG: hypothetical protein QXS91_00195 [Candidatus Anstonellales archaeon]